jgi:hypothetical protein
MVACGGPGQLLSEVMRIRIDGTHGIHVMCDRCNRPAFADSRGPVWVEWDGDSTQDDDPLVVCANCNATNNKRSRRLEATLGDVLLGLLLNAHEPLGPVGERIVVAHDFEGDLSGFIGEVSSLADVLNKAGLG